MVMMEIQIENLRRLELRPGDKFVLSVSGRISMERCAHMKEVWELFVGSDADRFPLLILDEGMKLSVISGDVASEAV
ncbi:hypothetical protein ABK249_02745 [Neorhizobium sp. Rsf11]|uniref:Uncharacterized protein n=1 Tax=Neorhizobium phenanthreniclasticum TaxID=3157917 RepID=A0ABV0LW55_9HYPH